MSDAAWRKWLGAGLLGLALLFGSGVLFGVTPLPLGRDSARPPCEELPQPAAVTAALAARPDLVRRLERVGPGVRVSVSTPCTDQTDRALATVTYRTKAEWHGVDAILREDGFGVAVELVWGRRH